MPSQRKKRAADDDNSNIIDHSRLNRFIHHQWQEGQNNTDLAFDGLGTTATGDGDRDITQETMKLGTVSKETEIGGARANLHWIMNATM